jgi:V8-like Glu-specific endopeptidase
MRILQFILLLGLTAECELGMANAEGGSRLLAPVTSLEVDEDRLNRERQPLETKPIYNADDRMDLGKLWDPELKKIAASTVALFEPSALTQASDGTYKISATTLGERFDLCQGQRFASQISAAFCSGVLIDPDTVITAGHCVNELIHQSNVPNANRIRFVFGFSAKDHKDPGVVSFAASKVFTGKELIRGQLIRKADGGEDWATVRLDRSVPSEVAQPIAAIAKQKIADGAGVFVMGHPSGLPLKHAGGAKVTSNGPKAYFVANLDTFGGNSGSGVFLKDGHTLVGILIRGFTDYYRTREGCSKAYQCSSNGCTGEDVMRVETLPLR